MAAVSPAYLEWPGIRYGRIGEPRRGPEEAVAELWQNADRLASGLVTQDGRRLKVLYPGRRNGSAGPDFRDCVLSTESGEIIVGDVEGHVTEGGWSAHGHNVDRNYNGVVLHVVLAPSSSGKTTTTLESRAEAPVVAIGVPSRQEGPEAGHIIQSDGNVSPSVIHKKLDRAGDDRFRSKADGYAMEIGAGDSEEVLYAGIMEALGYSANRRPFAALAARVPMAGLRALRDEPPGTRLLAIRAMLLSAAGLMGSVGPGDAERLRGVLAALPKADRIDEPWKTSRLRPVNHPVRRIEGAAVLVERALDEGLMPALAAATRRGEHRQVIDRLTAAPYVGEGRARDIAVNVALPFLHAWGGLARDRELRGASLEMFRRMPGLAENEITREMKRLLPPEVDTRGARRQQGLIHLYKHMRGTAWLEQMAAGPTTGGQDARAPA